MIVVFSKIIGQVLDLNNCNCVFTKGLEIPLPIRHGEGKILL